MTRLLPWLACLALLIAAFATQGAVRGQVQVESDSLSIDHKNKKASFAGNVKAEYLDLVLTCERLEARYGDDGSIVSLEARGKVEVKRKGAIATAQKASLDAGSGVLVLTGSPRVVQGPHELEGKRVTVNLKTGEVRVSRARGKFKLGPAESR